MSAENYVDYPLVILSRDKQTEVARVTADENGNYRSLCLQEITFWTSRIADAGMSARRRNPSR